MKIYKIRLQGLRVLRGRYDINKEHITPKAILVPFLLFLVMAL
jgi:hypothetical protein